MNPYVLRYKNIPKWIINCLTSKNGGGSSENVATAREINELVSSGAADMETGELLITIPDSLQVTFALSANGELTVTENYSNLEFNKNEDNLEVTY